MSQVPEESLSLRESVLIKPLRYEDRRTPISIMDAEPGEKCLIVGKIIRYHGNGRQLKAWAEDVNSVRKYKTEFNITFFHYNRWHTEKMVTGDTYAFLGKVTEYSDGNRVIRGLSQPTILEMNSIGMIVPIYKKTGHSSGEDIGKMIQNVLQSASDKDLQSITTPWVNAQITRQTPMSVAKALRCIRNPQTPDDIQRAEDTLVRMEILERAERTISIRRFREQTKGVMVHISPSEIAEFSNMLPYTLSPGQSKALESIRQSLASPWPSRILLMGGVASGKTAICHTAARAVVYGAREGRNKVLIVAPTQPLVHQLHTKFNEFFPSITTSSLVGSKPGAKIPDVEVYFGTHGSFNRSLQWERIGLVVFDEEHRFGTEKKFASLPETANRIFMSATPIPRSLSLFMFGEMELVRIQGTPNARRVETRLITRDQGKIAVQQVRETLNRNKKAIVVYGTISRAEEPDITWAGARYLSPNFPGDRVALLRQSKNIKDAHEESLMFGAEDLERFYRINKNFDARKLIIRQENAEPVRFPILAYDSDRQGSLYLIEKNALTEKRGNKRKLKKWDTLLKEIRANFYPEVSLVRESLYRSGIDMDGAVNFWGRNFPDKTAIIHGKMSGKEKEAVLKSFSSGQTPLIIATSIVEVGIDVEGVDCLVLANADKFGTASLVQLRGRVGRNGDPGVCILISPSDDGADYARLQTFAQETDDLKLAEMDFIDRGWGQIHGTAQSGNNTLFFNIKRHHRLLSEISEKVELRERETG